MTDYNIKVTSDTQDAEKKLVNIDKLADKATKPRNIKIDVPSLKDLEKGFTDVGKTVTEAATNIRTFYDTTKNLPVIGDIFKPIKETEAWARKLSDTGPRIAKVAGNIKEVSTASGALEVGMRSASTASEILITRLARIGFSLFALKEGANLLKAAFGGFFNETIGREIQLQETILKTQTTLASTNKVFKNGVEIADPYQKIVGLTGEIAKNIDSIRTRSIELAGVTSNDVIEVFGIVAGQIGEIGGGLKEAEDLAINFAAALGTFGIPLYQARQEIGSILRGDITMDSYLAKALGITNKDIADAKSKTGGVVAFIQDKLSAAVAGQKIAAQGFRGVWSNIKDLQELIGQKFGAGLLAPLISGLTKIFDTLFKIRGQIFGIAEAAGRTVGNVVTTFTGQIRGRVVGSSPEGDRSIELANKAQDLATKAFSSIEQIANRTVGAISRIMVALAPTVENLVQSFTLLAKVFVQIKVATFENLLSIIANLVQIVSSAVNAFSGLFKMYAAIISQPFAQYISEIATQMGFLKKAGLDTIFTIVGLFNFVKGTLGPVAATVMTVIVSVVAAIGTVIAAIGALSLALAGVATAFIGPLAFIKGAGVALKELSISLRTAGNAATETSARMNGMSVAMAGAANGAKGLALSLASSLGAALLLQIAITVVADAFGRFQRAKEEAAADRRADVALERLATTYKNVGDSADSATKAARDFERAIVSTNFNKALQDLEDVRKKINDIKYEMQKPGINTLDEFLALSAFNAVPLSRAFGSFGDYQKQLLEEKEKKEAEIMAKIAKLAKATDRDRAVDNFKIQADNAKQLAKEQIELDKERQKIEKSHKDRLFDTQQQIDNKTLDIFKLTSDIAIRQVELRNNKLIEGENGAAGAALQALANYISTKKKSELSLEVTKRQLQIQAAALDKSVVDYRLSVEERILAIKERIGKYEIGVANYILAQKQNEAAILTSVGQNGEGNILPGGVITPTASGGGFHSSRTRAGGVIEAHGAQDIGAEPGSRVNARLAGTLINILRNYGGNGDAAVIKYDNGETGTYGHINLSEGMRIGSRVSPGAQIGKINNPPPGFNPHLHYKLQDSLGKLIDPVTIVANSLKIKGNGSSTGAVTASNMTRFLAMVAMGESNDINSAVNPSSGTQGRFQFKDSTRTDALKRGLLTPTETANLLADDKNKQFAAVAKYIKALNPVAAAYIEAGDFNNAELMLSGARVGKGGNQLFTSLKGGNEAATGSRRAAMEKALGASNSATTSTFNLSEPVLNMKKLPALQTAEYKTAVETIKSLNEQYAALQARLENINSKAQFKDILKNLYPTKENTDLQATVDNLVRSLNTVQEAAKASFNPELYQIDMEEAKATALVKEQTLKWQQKFKELQGTTAAEKVELEKDEEIRRKTFMTSLQQEFDLRRQIVTLTRDQKYAVELIDTIAQNPKKQLLAMQQLQADRAAVFRNKDDYVGNRLSAINLQIEQERSSKSEELKNKTNVELFEKHAAALRANAVELGLFEAATAKITEKLNLAREAASTFVSGFKGIFKAALSGQDIASAVTSFTEGLSNKFIDMFSDYAFKPMEKQMEALFSKLFGVSIDPQTANTTATENNTSALLKLTDTVSIAAIAANNIVPGPNSTFGGLDPKGFSPEAGYFDAFTPTSAGSTITTLNTDLTGLGDTIKDFAPATTQAATGLQTVLGGMVTLATGAATIFGGLSQIGKGGTQNVLAGLGGVFGGLGGLFGGGGLGIFGKTFGGFRASGGPVLPSSSYIVGERGPELFSPSDPGSILPADATAGMFSNTRAALTPLAPPAPPRPMSLPGGAIDIRYEPQPINGVEYVTVKEFRQGVQEAANQGRDLAYSGMQLDPNVRRALGLT